ncbi:dihydrolipoamide acetyltransferase family protein [Cellulomonas cellasea]|uniref:Dihydrolipoamide acetyltransferase component of pyruvate dehydrogenase complex n=1 Tax=Cellulomonas cellasea TaxID=43670 RepID=A0A7W4UDE2_9CELL|nr:dihydrolipoamide acetyltransferase family protein [Cellulomonas cellasea]MBB2921784.1 pyruvate dehydrogenase E2 component (dihydrolipoamide acetyltransferase) [Cellulomonas cellasea]
MAIEEFAMPDLGEGLTEAELVSWEVAEGDTVALNQVIAEVETAKAAVQLPSPYAGVVARLLVEPGTTVPVGSPILAVDTAPAGVEGTLRAVGAGASSTSASAASAATPAGLPSVTVHAASSPTTAHVEASSAVADGGGRSPVAARTSVLVGYGPTVGTTDRPRRRPRTSRPGPPGPHAGRAPVDPPPPDHAGPSGRAAPPAGGTVGERPRTYPPVRKLAHELGVDLTRVAGTGPDGVITRDDVLALAHREPRSAPAGSRTDGTRAPEALGASAREDRTPVTGVRRRTAAAMVASAFTAPQATVFLTVDVTPTLELLDDLRRDRALAGHRLTLLTVVAKAVTIAVARTPEVNSRWDEAAGEIVQPHYVNLGIAAATPRGLLVPNVKDADRLRLDALADALTDLTERARAGTTPPADLVGGTITITNVGVFGIDAGTPILNPGESAILAVGAARRRPWEHRDQIALRSVVTLAVTFDHRVVDGEQAARFVSDVGAVLANPGSVLAMV